MLYCNLGNTLDFSIDFHPQSNGQTEFTNHTIIDLVKSYVDTQSKKEDNYLHILHFAYNNTTHFATDKISFETMYGHPLSISYTSF